MSTIKTTLVVHTQDSQNRLLHKSLKCRKVIILIFLDKGCKMEYLPTYLYSSNKYLIKAYWTQYFSHLHGVNWLF